MLEIKNIRIAGAEAPLAVLPKEADVCWQIADGQTGVFQKNFKIELFCGGKCVYKSKQKNTAEQRTVLPAQSLAFGTCYEAKISVTDTRGKKAEATASFATAYDDLPQRWIRPARHFEGGAVYFKKAFSVGEGLARA
ncbi:MAG: hypothetical protein J6V82_00845, partial [Clostridia bacterium]|nr:hypothetical protein [Clostridia bacterium]